MAKRPLYPLSFNKAILKTISTLLDRVLIYFYTELELNLLYILQTNHANSMPRI